MIIFKSLGYENLHLNTIIDIIMYDNVGETAQIYVLVKLEVPIQAAILNVGHIGIVRVVGNIIFQSTGSVNLCKPWTPKPYSRTKNCHDIFHGL